MRMRTSRLIGPVFAALLAAACGGGSPAGPPPVATHSVSVLVYYDQNGNSVRDANEVTRLGSVTVEAVGVSGTSARLTGRATLAGVPAGMQTFRARPESLPPYFQAREVVTGVPAGGEVELPVVLPIGANVPAVYLALGDSITVGDGSSDGRGYVPLLEDRLRVEWAQGGVINDGIEGNKSNQGADRIGGDLDRFRPACVLILLGTNDWNKCKDVDSCFTQDSMRSMLDQAFAAQTKPFLATIIPANPDDPLRNPPQRNEWVAAMNERLKMIAAEKGATVVDLYGAFMRASGDDLGLLFADHVHPNDRGHQVIADEYFKVLTSARSTNAQASAVDPARLLRNPAGGLGLGLPDDDVSSPLTPGGLRPLLLAPPPSSARTP